MADKSFVLMSLKEDKVKKMTQVLSNDTCRQILDFLSTTERATATEISKKLKLAMSTIHYNLKQLKDNNLVTSDEYTYSEKGKEIIHYGLANKYIIIAPKEDKNILDRLKGFLPITLISAFTGGLLYLIEKNWTTLMNAFQPKTQTLNAGIMRTAEITTTDMIATPEVASYAMDTMISEPTTGMLIAPWFLAGAAFTIIVMVAYELVRKKDE